MSGYDTREVLMTITVREKGKTLQESGGMVLTSSSWLAPEIAALKEQMDFDTRYARKVYGDLVSVEAMQQMAAAMAVYPGMQAAMERMSKERVNLSGTPLLTTMTFQTVANPQQAQQAEDEGSASGAGSVGGLMGGLARKMMKKKQEQPQAGATPGRTTIMTSTTQVLKISTDVAAADVALPPGFKEVR
jgi:hypothetical protein